MRFLELPKPLILASKSPRRAQLLRQIGLEFRVIASSLPEDLNNGRPPAELAQELALAKARHVAERIDEGLVLGADTIVVLEGVVLGKPADQEEARRMLKLLSGRTHEVYTGFAIIDQPGGKWVQDYERTEVTFRDLSDDEIEAYIYLDHPYDKAGAYGIQDHSALFVEKINGCYYNVVGFPLTKFYTTLKGFVTGKIASSFHS